METQKTNDVKTDIKQPKKLNTKETAYGCLIIIALIGVLILLSRTCSNEASTTSYRYIDGLNPVDVYLSLEDQGFTTNINIGGDYGHSWNCKHEQAGITYEVEISSPDDEAKVDRVRATARLNPAYKNIKATKQFFLYIATTPYKGANPPKATNWVNKNFNKNNASTTIGDATFTIYAPSIAVRMMTIEKNKSLHVK